MKKLLLVAVMSCIVLSQFIIWARPAHASGSAPQKSKKAERIEAPANTPPAKGPDQWYDGEGSGNGNAENRLAWIVQKMWWGWVFGKGRW